MLASASPLSRASLWPFPETVRRRAVALLFVVLIHLGLALLFLTLAPPMVRQKMADAMLFRSIEAPVAPPEPVEETPVEAEPAPVQKPMPVEQPPRPPETIADPAPPDPPPIILPPEESSAIAPPPPPPAPPRRVYGPPDLRPPPPPDSVRVDGSGPNGEPLYAAQWYREPYDNELRGYLSTAQGPGWGLIACRTVADYRVEDCVIVGEYPNGSGIARATHAAAWQFRVRPPRIGGRDQVGEWVRIRIDYHIRRTPTG